MKYEIQKDQRQDHHGTTVYRIMAVKDFVAGNRTVIKAGTPGGYIEDPKNLSQDGNCWVAVDAVVRDYALVRDDAVVCDNAVVRDYAVVCDDAIVRDNAVVRDYAVKK